MLTTADTVAIAAGLVAIEATVLGAAWRLSAWHTRQEVRLRAIESRIEDVEVQLAVRVIPAPRKRPSRRPGPRG